MRILFLNQHFGTPRHAGSTFPFVMARELVRRGHAVEVLTTDQSGRRGGWYCTDEDGFRIHWCPIPYSNRMRYGRRLIAFARFVARAVSYGKRLARFDVVYASSTPLTIALPGVALARRFRAPMIFEVRDLWPEVPIALGALRTPWSIGAARALERFAYRNA
ncbi:MAG: glycosyltransferase family 4 protein, partial [Thermogutta sp.]|nr:glycosyltransferase family 4 protein [Thermogutta sp.]